MAYWLIIRLMIGWSIDWLPLSRLWLQSKSTQPCRQFFCVLFQCSERCNDVDSVTVTIYIGGQPRDIGVFCGTERPKMLMSNNNRLEVTFVSRSIRPVTKGFQATYRFVEGNNNIRLLKIDKPQLNTQMVKVKAIHSTNIKLKEKHHQ